MFLHMLNKFQQDLFLKAAHLISVSDNELLWDGKTQNEITGDTDLEDVSLQESEHEKALLENFARECGRSTDPSHKIVQGLFPFSGSSESKIKWRLVEKLEPLPLNKQNDPEERIKAATAVLIEIINVENWSTNPAAPKIMLYELLLLALADGEISSVEGALIKEFCAFYKIEDFIYEDLLERAQSINRETAKTLSIILE